METTFNARITMLNGASAVGPRSSFTDVPSGCESADITRGPVAGAMRDACQGAMEPPR